MTDGAVNLNRARKARARAAKKARSDANAARSGRTKAQTAEEDAAATRARAHLDAHRRDDD